MWSAAPCPRCCPSCARRGFSRWNGTASGSSSSPARRPLPEGWRGTRRGRSQTAAAACTNGRGAHLPAAGKTAGFPGPFRKALFLVKSFPFFFALLFRTVEAEGFPYALKGRPMGIPRWAGRLSVWFFMVQPLRKSSGRARGRRIGKTRRPLWGRRRF